jgi:hypothetical protein
MSYRESGLRSDIVGVIGGRLLKSPALGETLDYKRGGQIPTGGLPTGYLSRGRKDR